MNDLFSIVVRTVVEGEREYPAEVDPCKTPGAQIEGNGICFALVPLPWRRRVSHPRSGHSDSCPGRIHPPISRPPFAQGLRQDSLRRPPVAHQRQRSPRDCQDPPPEVTLAPSIPRRRTMRAQSRTRSQTAQVLTAPRKKCNNHLASRDSPSANHSPCGEQRHSIIERESAHSTGRGDISPRHSTSAAALSLMLDALVAVMVPLLAKAGRSLANMLGSPLPGSSSSLTAGENGRLAPVPSRCRSTARCP